MSIIDQNTGSEAGKKFRLIVRSAEEAVRVIRDKLGDNAKVISVRQVGGEGLKRFISSPKLEVIAQVVEEPIDQIVQSVDTPITNPPSLEKSAEVKTEVPKIFQSKNHLKISPKLISKRIQGKQLTILISYLNSVLINPCFQILVLGRIGQN